MIDIHQSVLETRKHKTLKIVFGADNEAILYEVKPRHHRRLVNAAQNISAHADKNNDGKEFDMKINPDWQGLAINLCHDAVGWENIPGTFDKAVLLEWLENNGKYAEAIGQNFKAALDAYDEENTVRRDAEAKNS